MGDFDINLMCLSGEAGICSSVPEWGRVVGPLLASLVVIALGGRLCSHRCCSMFQAVGRNYSHVLGDTR